MSVIIYTLLQVTTIIMIRCLLLWYIAHTCIAHDLGQRVHVSRRHLHNLSFDCLLLLLAVIRNDVYLKVNTLSPSFAKVQGMEILTRSVWSSHQGDSEIWSWRQTLSPGMLLPCCCTTPTLKQTLPCSENTTRSHWNKHCHVLKTQHAHTETNIAMFLKHNTPTRKQTLPCS